MDGGGPSGIQLWLVQGQVQDRCVSAQRIGSHSTLQPKEL